jgi:hypothetical protein
MTTFYFISSSVIHQASIWMPLRVRNVFGNRKNTVRNRSNAVSNRKNTVQNRSNGGSNRKNSVCNANITGWNRNTSVRNRKNITWRIQMEIVRLTVSKQGEFSSQLEEHHVTKNFLVVSHYVTPVSLFVNTLTLHPCCGLLGWFSWEFMGSLEDTALTVFMEHSPSWEADSQSTGHEVPPSPPFSSSYVV